MQQLHCSWCNARFQMSGSQQHAIPNRCPCPRNKPFDGGGPFGLADQTGPIVGFPVNGQLPRCPGEIDQQAVPAVSSKRMERALKAMQTTPHEMKALLHREGFTKFDVEAPVGPREIQVIVQTLASWALSPTTSETSSGT